MNNYLNVLMSLANMDSFEIFNFMEHLIRQYEISRVAFLHPDYTAKFYVSNGNPLAEIWENSSKYPAAEFLYGTINFEVLLVPCLARKPDLYPSSDHWMLAIYDVSKSPGQLLFTLYDPKPKYDDKNNQIFAEGYQIILQHILKTVVPGVKLEGIVSLPRSQYNYQANTDFESSKFFVCYYAKEYLFHRTVPYSVGFDIHKERNAICQILEEAYRTNFVCCHNFEKKNKYIDAFCENVEAQKNEKQCQEESNLLLTVLNRMETQESKHENSRKIELDEQHKQKLEINRLRTAALRSMETEERRKRRLEENRLRTARLRNMESKEQYEQRLKRNRLRVAIHRKLESDEQRAQRLEDNRLRSAFYRKMETDEQRKQRLERNRLRISKIRSMESEEQRAKRLEEGRLRIAFYRTMETDEQRTHRLEQNRMRIAKLRGVLRRDITGETESNVGVVNSDGVRSQTKSIKKESFPETSGYSVDQKYSHYFQNESLYSTVKQDVTVKSKGWIKQETRETGYTNDIFNENFMATDTLSHVSFQYEPNIKSSSIKEMEIPNAVTS